MDDMSLLSVEIFKIVAAAVLRKEENPIQFLLTESPQSSLAVAEKSGARVVSEDCGGEQSIAPYS